MFRMPYKDKTKQKEFQTQWMAKRRKQWLEQNGPCGHCESWDDLEVDHFNPELKVSHKIWSWSDVRRTEELSKCVVLCKKCNNFKATTLKMKVLKHGTEYAYRNKKCRCATCVAYKRAYDKAWRSQHK